MSKFQLPADGSVLIIDDKIDEALPLIKLFSKRGIASTYFSGKNSGLPPKPAQKIRLAFVDIQLFGPSDSHSYAANILRILDTIIAEDNGPYILIIWSTLERVHADTLENQVTSASYSKRPVVVLRLEKASFFSTVTDFSNREELLDELNSSLGTRFPEDDLEAIRTFISNNIQGKARKVPMPNAINIISEELEEKLKEANSFHLFIIWENLINKAAGDIVNTYSSLHDSDDFWEDNLKHSIYRMAHAQLGETVDSVDEEDLIRNALKTLNHTFLDAVENEIHQVKNLSRTIKIDRKIISFSKAINSTNYKIGWRATSRKYQLFIDGILVPAGHRGDDNLEKIVSRGRNPAEKLDVQIIADEYISNKPEINNRLLLDFNVKQIYIQPGNVYEKQVPHWNRRKNLLKNYFKKSSKVLDNLGVYKITNADLKRVVFIELEITPLCDFVQGKWKKSRLLPGVLIPEEYALSIQNPDSFYSQIPIVRFKGKNYKPIFDFRFFKSVDIEKDENILKKPIFRVRSELFSDILSRLSSHASRVGIAYLE